MSSYKIYKIELRHLTCDNYWDFDVNESKKFCVITLHELQRKYIQYMKSNIGVEVCTSLPTRIHKFRQLADIYYEWGE